MGGAAGRKEAGRGLSDTINLLKRRQKFLHELHMDAESVDEPQNEAASQFITFTPSPLRTELQVTKKIPLRNGTPQPECDFPSVVLQGFQVRRANVHVSDRKCADLQLVVLRSVVKM